ncbi:MAG TPA: PDZ domain-containing protein [Gaiellaceae bacterium]|jgi:PDZ domain-containing protein
MVDIVVRKASLLEWLLPHLHLPQIEDGASLVPAEAVNPAGVSEGQRIQQSLNEMSQSQLVAAAVALRYLGHKVNAKPDGAEVTLVFPNTPATGKLEIGDVIIEANGKPVETTGDLRTAMEGVKPGEPVTFVVRRSGGRRDVRLGTQPDQQDPERAVVGVLIEQSADIHLPVNVRINAGSIGGPSAGLAFALDIVDESGHDVDDGRRIVVTGALDLNGRVEPIGGVKQKTIAAREAHADLFLVPDGNLAEARRYAGSLDVLPVTTFREALSVLAKS